MLHYTDGEVATMNRTARDRGAIGSNPVTLRYVATVAGQGDLVLDYGSGKARRHAVALAEQTGATVDAFEIGANRTPQHVPTVTAGAYDVAYASNVLNVQPSRAAALCVLRDLRAAVHSAGLVVFNYPFEPCHHKPEQMNKSEVAALAIAAGFGYCRESDDCPGVFLAMRP